MKELYTDGYERAISKLSLNANETDLSRKRKERERKKKTRIGTNIYHRCRVKTKHEDGCSYGVTNELMVKGPLCTHPFLINHLK